MSELKLTSMNRRAFVMSSAAGALRERQETGEQDLFRSRLDRIIDLTHVHW